MKKECINGRLHEDDFLTMIKMYIKDCFNSFLKYFPLFKTLSSSRMWFSYEILSDKKYRQNLKHLYEGK